MSRGISRSLVRRASAVSGRLSRHVERHIRCILREAEERKILLPFDSVSVEADPTIYATYRVKFPALEAKVSTRWEAEIMSRSHGVGYVWSGRYDMTLAGEGDRFFANADGQSAEKVLLLDILASLLSWLDKRLDEDVHVRVSVFGFVQALQRFASVWRMCDLCNEYVQKLFGDISPEDLPNRLKDAVIGSVPFRIMESVKIPGFGNVLAEASCTDAMDTISSLLSVRNFPIRVANEMFLSRLAQFLWMSVADLPDETRVPVRRLLDACAELPVLAKNIKIYEDMDGAYVRLVPSGYEICLAKIGDSFVKMPRDSDAARRARLLDSLENFS